MADQRPAVAIYRQQYLPPSETFIVDHVAMLSAWNPVPIYEERYPGGLGAGSDGAVCLHQYSSSTARRLEAASFTRAGICPRLDEFAHKRDIRLLHAHFLTDGTRLVNYAARKGLPLVVTAHGYDATTYDSTWARTRAGRLFLRRRARLFKQAAAILCVSAFLRDELLRRGAPAEKLLVRPLGVDLGRFAEQPPAGTRKGAVFVGRLVEKKGAHYLIEAWKRLPLRLRSQGLTIIGSGPDAERLQALAGDDANVHFLGFRSREAVMQAMASHRVFAFPSLRAPSGDAEGMGIVAMEAQAMGTPVIGFDEGPLREVLSPGVSGLLASPGDVGQLAACLQAVLEDDDLASRLGAGARDQVADRFDLARNMGAIERVYDRIVERASPVGAPDGPRNLRPLQA